MEFARQRPQSIVPGNEVVFQDLFTRHINHPLGLLGAEETQPIRGVTFDRQAIQGKFDVCRIRQEQQSLPLDHNPPPGLSFAEGGMKGVAGIGWSWSFQGVRTSSTVTGACQNRRAAGGGPSPVSRSIASGKAYYSNS